MSEGNGVNGVAHAQEEVRQISEVRKLNKIDIKRMQAHEERKRRLINKGIPENKVEGIIAAEDYANLPIEEKFLRFEKIASQALQGLQRDILALRHNDGVIADAMDINLKAMAKALEKAGVSKEAQGDIIKEVEVELREEQKQRMQGEEDAKAMAARMSAEQIERSKMQAEADKKPEIASEATPAETPEGATVFEG